MMLPLLYSNYDHQLCNQRLIQSERGYLYCHNHGMLLSIHTTSTWQSVRLVFS